MPNWLKEKGIIYIKDKIYVFQLKIIKFILVITIIENMAKMELIY